MGKHFFSQHTFWSKDREYDSKRIMWWKGVILVEISIKLFGSDQKCFQISSHLVLLRKNEILIFACWTNYHKFGVGVRHIVHVFFDVYYVPNFFKKIFQLALAISMNKAYLLILSGHVRAFRIWTYTDKHFLRQRWVKFTMGKPTDWLLHENHIMNHMLVDVPVAVLVSLLQHLLCIVRDIWLILLVRQLAYEY